METISIGQRKHPSVGLAARSHPYKDATQGQCRSAALFLPSLDGGGAERVFLNLAQALVENGVCVDIVLAKRAGHFLSSVPMGANLVDLSHTRPLRAVPSLVRYLRAKRPSVLLSTITNANVAALLAHRLATVPTRVIVREANTLSSELKNTSTLDRLVVQKIVQWFYPLADVIVAPSNGVADDLAAVTGVRRERIRVIYNPIVSNALLAKARDTPDHPWLQNNQIPVVLGIGRLTRQKNFSTLIRAFAIARRHLPARLLIIGEGREHALLQGLIQREGLSADVALIGFVENPYAFLSRAAVFVLSSEWEGLPGVLIEALACKAAVVSTDCPNGPNEILAGGKYGQLVPVGNVEAMASAILKVLKGEYVNPDLTEHLSLFDVQRNTYAYLGLLLKSVLQHAGPC
jgi:glycosyltransferase involved in cell wall biosynthesis